MSKIAPHEGKELQLVLEGKKVFAVVEQAKDPVQFGMIMTDKNVVVKVHKGEEGNDAHFWLNGDVWGEPTYKRYRSMLRNSGFLITTKGQEWYQREMGRIFGYTNEEIDSFISGDIKCNCTKCKGVSHNVR